MLLAHGSEAGPPTTAHAPAPAETTVSIQKERIGKRYPGEVLPFAHGLPVRGGSEMRTPEPAIRFWPP